MYREIHCIYILHMHIMYHNRVCISYMGYMQIYTTYAYYVCIYEVYIAYALL